MPPTLLSAWVHLPYVRTRQELKSYVLGPLVPILVAILSALLVYMRSQFTKQGVLALSPRRFFRVRIGWHEPVTIEHRARTKHRAPYLVVAGATEVIDVPCDGSLRAHAYLIGCRRFGGANHPITVALTQHIEDVSAAPGSPRSHD